MKKIFFLSVIIAMILSDYNYSTPRGIKLDEWALGGPFQHERSDHIDNVVLYCREEYSVFIKLENKDTQKIGRRAICFKAKKSLMKEG